MTATVLATSDRNAADPSERLAVLFETHHERLFRLALRLLGEREEARDLVQESFLRAARSFRSVPAEGREAEAWLVRVAVNLCRDRFRRRAVRGDGAPLGIDLPDPGSGPEARAVARATVIRALAHLPPRRRAVLVLHELEELPVAEIARLLGIGRVTVRWHLAAGRRGLAQVLAPNPGVTA
jgi:RNA polymerase sigma-70 factor (ECF subfamily)